jgi:predicted transposase YbfD/YdcC
VTADALLTQRGLASYLRARGAHYLFTVKANQKTLLADLEVLFARRGKPDFQEEFQLVHGRMERRSIWVSTAANGYLNFPDVGQAYLIERERIGKKTGRHSLELAYGITSRTPASADAQRVLALNRGHWVIENSCHYVLDWNWDEDRSTIRTGYGPENTSRLRRFAIGVLHLHTHGEDATRDTIAATMQRLHRNVRLVFDFLRMTRNSQRWRRHPPLRRTN